MTRKIFFVCLSISFVLVISGCDLHGLSLINQKEDQNEPGILYLAPAEENSKLFFYSQKNEKNILFSDPDKFVYDYSVNQDMTTVLINYWNEDGGSDISMITPTGGEIFLKECGVDICSSPNLSPGRDKLVLERIMSGQREGETSYSLEIYDLAMLDNPVVTLDQRYSGTGAEFSPDGRFLSYQQIAPNRLIILDNQGNQKFSFSGNILHNAYEWSPDSKMFYFVTQEINDDKPMTTLWVYDLVEEAFKEIAISLPGNVAIANMKMSFDGKMLALLVKSSIFTAEQQIWVYGLEEEKMIAQTNKFSSSFGLISWKSNNEQILFQELNFSLNDQSPEVGFWDYQTGEFTYFVENAYYPQWYSNSGIGN